MNKFERLGAERPSKKSEKEPYHFEREFKDLELKTIELVKQLKERIDSGDYDLIISEETSGRIPSLIFRKIINERNKKLHPEKSDEENEIQVRFLNPLAADKKLLKVSEDLKNHIKKKALVITEYINNGKTISKLAKVLKDSGINFDIAIIAAAISPLDKYPQYNPSLRGIDMFAGSIGHKPRSLEGGLGDQDLYFLGELRRFSGVKKIKHGGAYPRITLEENYKRSAAGLKSPLITKEEWSKNVNLSRKDANVLADRALEKVWGEEKK